ncbi:TIGR02281 family clan AA aspartic protease [Rhodospirillaceae bacterium SYSU D60014]|uniref:retropepsin-like aspartic protease family protein n=1 Tax=Virgifigura deserti TaxID=2268457 RepID=UPI0013C40E79
MRRPGWILFALAGAAFLALVVFLVDRFPGALDDTTSQARLVYLLLLLTVLGGSVLLHARARPGTTLRHAAVWIAIGMGLVIVYSYRDLLPELQSRLMGELMPQRGVAVGDGAISFRARDDGHFHAEAMVDGVAVLFLVDTGASEVVLSPDDARRLGFDPDRLAYTQVFHTANGTVRGAPVRLGEIVIGPIRLANVRASVNEAPMPRSLLGMTFLGRLSGYEVSGGELTLRR